LGVDVIQAVGADVDPLAVIGHIHLPFNRPLQNNMFDGIAGMKDHSNVPINWGGYPTLVGEDVKFAHHADAGMGKDVAMKEPTADRSAIEILPETGS
jgi:hypothetical protein